MALRVCVALLLGLLLPVSASAQSVSETVEPADETNVTSRIEVALVGGLGGYTGSLSQTTDVGPVFGFEVDVPVWRSLQLELGYRGFNFPITDTRLVQQSIWSHGVRAAAKVSVPYTRTVSPFVSIGAGFLVVDPTSEADDLFRSDAAFEIPAAIGIQFETEFLEASIRGGWSGLLGQSVTREDRLGPLRGGLLTGGLSLGVRL